MRRELLELVCDTCGRGDREPGVMVATRRVAVDGVTVESEVCEKCWAELMAVFAAFATHGRKVPARTRVKDAVELPGTSWRWSAHALQRLGERKLDPMEVVRMLAAPDVTRPGNASDLTVCEGRKVKAVVARERGIVITVARQGDQDLE